MRKPFTFKTPPTECPACHHKIDHGSALTGAGTEKRRVRPGDVSICMACLVYLMITKGLGVRLLTDAEWMALPVGHRELLTRTRDIAMKVKAAKGPERRLDYIAPFEVGVPQDIGWGMAVLNADGSMTRTCKKCGVTATSTRDQMTGVVAQAELVHTGACRLVDEGVEVIDDGTCQRCEVKYPSAQDYLREFFDGATYQRLCGVCALERLNEVHQTSETAFAPGTAAESLRRGALRFRMMVSRGSN